MRPVKPRIIPRTGIPFMYADLPTEFSNVIGAHIAGNRRSAAIAPLERSVIDKHLYAARNQLSSRTRDSNIDSWLKMIKLDVPNLLGDRMAKLGAELTDWVAGVVGTPVPIRDFGAWIAIELKKLARSSSNGDGEVKAVWRPHAVMSAALGWPREYLLLNSSSGFEESVPAEKRGRFFMTTNPCSSWNMDHAKTWTTLDMGRYNISLLPPATKVGLHDPKSRPFGEVFALVEQLKELYAFHTLYLLQGSLMIPHQNERAIRKAIDLIYTQHPTVRPATDRWMEDFEFVLSQRQHPLQTFITSAARTGVLETYYGTKDLLLHFGALANGEELRTDQDAQDLDDQPAHDFNKREHLFYDEFLQHIMAEFAIGASDSDEITEQWGSGCSNNLGAESENAPISIPSLARRIRSLGKLGDRMNTIANTLGWGTLSGNIGTINQCMADFILCDGDAYSAPADAGLLGLRPVLSMGNIKYNVFSIRHDDTFNGKGESTQTPRDNIEYSTMTVPGFQSPTTMADVVARSYLPAGMWMGEQGADAVHPNTIGREAHFRAFIKSLQAKGQVFNHQYYHVPNMRTKETPVHIRITDWDVWAYGGAKEDLIVQMGQVYPRLSTAEEQTFFVRSRFNHRFPVKMARGRLRWYDEYGQYGFDLDWDGHLEFDDSELALSTGHMSSLQAIVEATSVTSTIEKSQLPSGGQEQIDLQGPTGLTGA